MSTKSDSQDIWGVTAAVASNTQPLLSDAKEGVMYVVKEAKEAGGVKPMINKVSDDVVKNSDKILDKSDKYGKNFEEKTENLLKRAESNLLNKKVPMKFTLDATIFAINATELTFTCAGLLVIAILNTVLPALLLLVFWVPIIASGVYLVFFIIIWKLKEKFKERSAVFFILAVMMLSEWIMLTFMGIIYSGYFMLAECMIACSSMYTICIYAGILKDNYSANTGRLIAVLIVVLTYVVFVIFTTEKTTTILLVFYI
jgi:hypothetical protein